jgi:hypothetical protein
MKNVLYVITFLIRYFTCKFYLIFDLKNITLKNIIHVKYFFNGGDNRGDDKIIIVVGR